MKQRKLCSAIRSNNNEMKVPPDKAQVDQERFLQAFEKPTQIYRYLQSRNKFMPLFLQRNVSYMKRQTSGSKRKNFRINSLLAKAEARQKNEALKKQGYKSDFLNLKLLGFYNSGTEKLEQAKVEAFITRVSHKKRKNSSSVMKKLSVGSVNVPCFDITSSPPPSSPSTNTPPASLSTSSQTPQSISLGCDHFRNNLCNGTAHGGLRSFVLLFRATVTLRRCGSSASSDTGSLTGPASLVNGHCSNIGGAGSSSNNGTTRITRSSPSASISAVSSGNSVVSTSTLDSSFSHLCNGSLDEPEDNTPKRRTRSTSDLEPFTEPSGVWTPKRRKVTTASSMWSEPETRMYSAELTIYDRSQRCLLLDGDYDVVMHEEPVVSSTNRYLCGNNNNKKHVSWETGTNGQAINAFEIFNQCPSMRFKLSWNKRPLEGSVQSPPPKSSSQEKATAYTATSDKISSANKEARSDTNPSGIHVYYQFVYNGKPRQQTEARDDMCCPWCAVWCKKLYSLLKHLRTCHSRFIFHYVELPTGGARIDVSVNDSYDGSYVGNPHSLSAQLGYAFSRNGPVRRTSATHVIVYRPKKPGFDLAEFTEAEGEAHASRQLMQGHNRLYYHTGTAQPIRPDEIDIDSENENDPEWLRQKTVQLIDDFTDVNEGEKAVMKMWNLHVMQFNYIADCQMSDACERFVSINGPTLVNNHLTRNFILHLCNLHDVGLLRNEAIYKIIRQLLAVKADMQSARVSNNSEDIKVKISEVMERKDIVQKSLDLESSINS